MAFPLDSTRPNIIMVFGGGYTLVLLYYIRKCHKSIILPLEYKSKSILIRKDHNESIGSLEVVQDFFALSTRTFLCHSVNRAHGIHHIPFPPAFF
uniref:Uncharacterized protein n=1 Tax=Lepeophtheirus salmonis TaxID=72036 RepID=A0A0K2V9A4_LEPSM